MANPVIRLITKVVEGRSSKWAGVRKNHLTKHPLCTACGKNKNLEVHHILPFHLFPELELEESNLITLCDGNKCHIRIGHCFNWKAYNPFVINDSLFQYQRIIERKTTK